MPTNAGIRPMIRPPIERLAPRQQFAQRAIPAIRHRRTQQPAGQHDGRSIVLAGGAQQIDPQLVQERVAGADQVRSEEASAVGPVPGRDRKTGAASGESKNGNSSRHSSTLPKAHRSQCSRRACGSGRSVPVGSVSSRIRLAERESATVRKRSAEWHNGGMTAHTDSLGVCWQPVRGPAAVGHACRASPGRASPPCSPRSRC